MELIRQAILKANEVEKLGKLNGKTKRQFAGEWLYYTDYIQKQLELGNLCEIWGFIDVLDDYYAEVEHENTEMPEV